MKKISIIIPCYNEEKTLPIMYSELCNILSRLNIYDFEILFINDGSSDSTLDIIKSFSEKDDRVIYLSFSRNFGKEAAMFAGFCNAKGDYTAIMDADMQDPPDLLPKMLEIIETGKYDSVATRREDRKGEPRVRSFFAHMFYKIINILSDADIVDGARDFRLMNRNMLDSIISLNEYNRFSKGIFGWVGFKTFWLPYENRERVGGESKWSFHKLSRYALDGIISFSQLPLNIASVFGLIMTIVSFVFLLIVIVRKLIYGDPVAGWASTICVILFMGSIQLFCIGVIGQYIGKIHMESKKRPHYIISDSNLENLIKIK